MRLMNDPSRATGAVGAAGAKPFGIRYDGSRRESVTMSERDYLAERFEEHRTHLRAVAYRMLGSVAEVDDAVQEAWLRLSRADAKEIDNLGGWLTTVVARVCLDMLRSRKSRREEPFAPQAPEPIAPGSPEQEAVLADSVGLALLVVLDRLTPAERLAFVLHDMTEDGSPAAGRTRRCPTRRSRRMPRPGSSCAARSTRFARFRSSTESP